MKQSTKDAYAEVDAILNLMDEKYTKMIPKGLRTMIKAKKTRDYEKKIVSNKPLSEQEISEEALSILAALNYSYWCKNEKRKKELLELYSNNERSNKNEQEEISNFNSSIESISEEVKQEMLGLIIYKEPKWYKKIFGKILNVFKKRKIR